MRMEELQEYCKSKKGATESFPFDDKTLVYKVGNKMFSLVSLEPPFFANLKCNPEKAIELREMYEQITPGYHMNKANWNSVYFENGLKTSLVKSLIDDSYNLIVDGLPKKVRDNFE